MGKTKRRARNNIHHGAPDTSVLNGVAVPTGSTDTKTITEPLGSRCPECRYVKATHCTCPGGPRAGLS